MASNDLSPETRTSLIRRVCELEPASWIEFVGLYDPLLKAYVGSCDQRFQLALNDVDREEIKQDVLIKLFHQLSSFKTQLRFRTWLWPVTRNVVIDWLRQNRGRGTKPENRRPSKVALTPELAESLKSASETPDMQLIREHDQHLLRHIFEKVKGEMRSTKKWECFAMHYLEGKPSNEVAALLEISVTLVNTNTSRVRSRIREWCKYYDVEL
jgi:RNA polymerase sigma-70 factor (ECF subfamily)